MNEISTSRMQHHADYSMKSAEGAGGLGLIRGNKNRRIRIETEMLNLLYNNNDKKKIKEKKIMRSAGREPTLHGLKRPPCY